MNIKEIEIEKIVENPWNPNEMREEVQENLVSEIKKIGYLQPILVRPKGKKYQVIDGEHRLVASKKAGLKKIKCVVVDMDDKQARTVTINMNKLKGDINVLKYAKLLRTMLKDFTIPELSVQIYEPEIEIEALQIILDAPEGELENEREKRKGKIRFIDCPHCGEEIELNKVEIRTIENKDPQSKVER